MKCLKSGSVIDIFKTKAKENLMFQEMVASQREPNKIFVFAWKKNTKKVLILVTDQRSGSLTHIREILGLFHSFLCIPLMTKT